MIKHRFQFMFLLSTALVVCISSAPAQTLKDLPTLSAVERELKGGETQSYRIVLTAGQFLHALVEQKDIDFSVAAFGPDGKQVTYCDSPNDRWGTESILLVAPESGEYRVD